MRTTQRDNRAARPWPAMTFGRRLAVAAAIAMALLAWLAVPATAALSVGVSPARAHVRPDADVQFTALVRDADGNQIDAQLVWSVIPPRLGTVDNGQFSASDELGKGIVRVVALRGEERGAGHGMVEVGVGEPGRLSVVVSPARAALDPEEQLLFLALVTDPSTGEEVEADVLWSVVPDRLGVVDGDGSFTAGDEGSGRVVARAFAGGLQGLGDAGVVIGPTSPSGIEVTVIPGHTRAGPGSEVQFDVRVVGEGGDHVEAGVTWDVIPAGLGVVTPDGLFTAGPDPMAGRIVATVVTEIGPVRGFASVEVQHPGPGTVRVRVTPREVAVGPGGDAQFQVEVMGPDGEPLEIPVEWQVRPDWLGTIVSTGLFIAAEEFTEPSSNGGWMGGVVASVETADGVVSDAARVRVREDGPPKRLKIYPRTTTVAPGEDVQFEASVIGAGDLDDWTTEWAVFPENLGTVTPDGLFTASPAFGDPSSGDFGPQNGFVGARATLSDGSTLTDRAHIRVRVPGEPVRIVVRPGFAIVPPNESQQFVADAIGEDGQIIGLPVVWRLSPTSLGTISPDGLFTAADHAIDPSGWQRPRGMVVAELAIGQSRTFRGVAAIVVDLPDPEAVVRVSPKSMSLDSGESFQFDVDVEDTGGNPLDLPVEWRVVDAAVGNVTQDGRFTASEWIAPGQNRRTQLIAGVVYGGRVYWDFATVTVEGG